MANFNVEQLFQFVQSEIYKFSMEHHDETFYGFAIDANLICFNSLEKFRETLKGYQEQWGGYTGQEEIENLKSNTGDWAYQGFAKLNVEVGFDMDSYLDHYHSEAEDQLNSEYAKAMNELIERLKKSESFNSIKKTSDFFISRVEHTY